MIIIKKIFNKFIIIISKLVQYLFKLLLRIRIKNKDFSIICSNCIGGVIYNRLNMKFLSPTINCWMHQYDFLKFVSNLKYYLSLNLKFIDDECNYPVAELDDIKVYFNHSKSIDDARQSWDRRKKRVNYDNIYIIMYDRDGISKDDILKLEHIKCKNKAVLTTKVYEDIDFCYTLHSRNIPHDDHFMARDVFGIHTFEIYFNFVKFLNSSNGDKK